MVWRGGFRRFRVCGKVSRFRPQTFHVLWGTRVSRLQLSGLEAGGFRASLGWRAVGFWVDGLLPYKGVLLATLGKARPIATAVKDRRACFLRSGFLWFSSVFRKSGSGCRDHSCRVSMLR